MKKFLGCLFLLFLMLALFIPASAATEQGYPDSASNGEAAIVGADTRDGYSVMRSDDHTWGEWTVISEADNTGLATVQRVCADDDAHIETETRTAPRVTAAFLNISSDISIKYVVSLPEGFTNAYAVFGFNGVDYTVRTYTENDGTYIFTFKGITPERLGDTVTATVYAEVDGLTLTAVLGDYSVKTYCENQLKKNASDTTLVTLISDLLTYGAKSQIYTDYKTDALVTEGLTLSPSDFAELDESCNKKALVGDADESAVWKGVGLKCGSTMIMYFRFAASDVEDLTVKIELNGRSKTYTASDFKSEEDGIYRIDFSGITATEFNDTVTASFERDGVAVGQSAIYSVNTYIYLYQNSTNTVLKELLRATSLYGASAVAYDSEKDEEGNGTGLAGSGTEEDPYVLVQPGDYTCAFPGGSNPVWYSLTVRTGGYVTVSTEFATGWLLIGLDTYAVTSNDGSGESVTVYVPAGATCYIGVGDWQAATADVGFTVSFEPVISDDWSSLVGTWSCVNPMTGNTYTLVINADGTGTYSENLGYYVGEYTLTYLVVDGNTVLIGYANENTSGSMSMTYADDTLTYAPNMLTNLVFTQGADGGGATADTDLVIGGNNQIEASDVTFVYTATEDGTLVLNLGNAAMGSVEAAVTVNGGTAEMLYAGSSVSLTLVAGDEVSIAFTASGYATLTASFTGGSSEGGEEGGVTGTGTASDPYVIQSIPYSVTYEGSHDKYYSYTATEDCIIVISYSDGALISDLPAGWEKDAAAMTYTFSVAAGATVKINLWTMRSSGTFVYSFAFGTPAEEGGDGGEGGDGDNGGATDTVLTYLSVNANGRKMKVEINKTADTMVVTRSDATGNFTGGATSVTYASYSAVVAGTVSSASGNITAILFDANGVPTSVTWMGVNYTNFVQQ